MEVRLDKKQWARILAMSGDGDGHAAGTANAVAPGLSAAAASLSLAPPPRSNEVVYALALEGDKPGADWSWWEYALDTVVQTVQPAPAMTHIELIIPAQTATDDVHFGTYLGKRANWGSGFGDSLSYYLDPKGNGPSWRATPIMAHGAVSRMRKECDQHVDTPYGDTHRLFNYPFSVPPFRSLAWTLDDAPKANAHCATLAARCLKRALPELNLEQASAWYGPSTLFLELSRKARMTSYRKRMLEMATVKALPETEEAIRASEVLVRGSDDEVRALDDVECRAGIDLLCLKSVTATVDDDVTAERLAQQRLARALLRESLSARAARTGMQQAQQQAQQPAAREPGEGTTTGDENPGSERGAVSVVD